MNTADAMAIRTGLRACWTRTIPRKAAAVFGNSRRRGSTASAAGSRDGKLTSLRHEGWEISSRPDPYAVGGTKTTTRMYACPNVDSRVSIVRADRNTPGYATAGFGFRSLAMRSAMARRTRAAAGAICVG
jgi:hypothetical protein